MNQFKDLQPFADSIGVKFNNINLLHQAFVHRSYLNEHTGFPLGHNERLEFLGDAVLELVVTEYIYSSYDNPEGELTNWRAALVNADTLAGIGRELNVEPFLYLSRGEERDVGTKARHYILANTLEAIIGALYLDQGMEETRNFIHRFILVKLPEILENSLYVDPKSHFQEKAQEIVGVTPAYRVLEETGPDHAKHFRVGVFIGKDMVAEGAGTSKQEAQIDAAREALKAKEWGGNGLTGVRWS